MYSRHPSAALHGGAGSTNAEEEDEEEEEEAAMITHNCECAKKYLRRSDLTFFMGVPFCTLLQHIKTPGCFYVGFLCNTSGTTPPHIKTPGCFYVWQNGTRGAVLMSYIKIPGCFYVEFL